MGKVVKLKVTRDRIESIYRTYPKKMGKAPGMKVVWRAILTMEDAELLSQAIQNYRKHLEKSRTSSEFILYFSTFMNQWKDWLDPDHGTSESFDGQSKKDLSDIFNGEKDDDPGVF